MSGDVMPPSDLIRNGHLIATAYHSLTKGAAGLDSLPLVLDEIGEQEMWRRFIHEETGQEFENRSFREFVTSPPPKGLGAQPETIERICYEKDNILKKVRRWLTGTHGGDRKSAEYEIKSDNITLDNERGTSKAYGLTWLDENRPDLYQAVLRKELTVNRAMQQAGKRHPMRSIPADDPVAAARSLARAFDAAQLQQLIAELARFLVGAPD